MENILLVLFKNNLKITSIKMTSLLRQIFFITMILNDEYYLKTFLDITTIKIK